MPAAAGGVTVATVWLDVLASVKNMGASLTTGVVGPAGKAGALAGAEIGDKTAEGVRKKGSNIGNAMATGFLAAGAAGVAAGKFLYDIGATFDDVADKIRVGTGATGVQLDGLVASAKNVGTSVPASFEDVSTAITDLNVRLGLTGKPLEDMAAQFLNLSKITGTDVKTNVANLTRVFGDWGISSADQAGALDKVFRASQATGVGLDQLSQSAVKFGAPMRQLGFSFEQTLALLGNFEKAGVSSGLVMGSMRKALGTMAKAGEEPVATLARVTDQIKNAGSAGEANTIALKLFGAKAGPDMAAAIREGRFEVGALTDQITNGGDTINAAATETQDFAESWLMFKNRVMVWLEPMASAVFGGIANAMDWVNNASEPVKATLGFIGGILGVLVVGVLAVVAATKIWAVVQIALNTAFLSSGITWIVLAVVGLVAAVVWAWQNFEGFRDVVTAVWNAIYLGIQFAWDIIQNVWAAIWAGLQWLGAFFTGFWNVVSTVWNAIWTVISAVWGFLQPIWTAIQFGLGVLGLGFQMYWAVVQMVWNGIWAVISFVWTGVSAIFGWLASGVTAIGGVFSGLGTVAAVVWGGIMSVISGVWGVISGIFNAIKTAIGAVGDSFRFAVDVISRVWNTVKDIVMAPVRVIVDVVYNKGIRGVWNFIAGIFKFDELAPVTFAKGGVLPGFAPGRDVVPALLSPGEGVLTPQAVRMIGADTVLALNSVAGRSGQADPLKGNPPFDLMPRFGLGGIVDWIGETASTIWNVVRDPVGAIRGFFEGKVDTGGVGGGGKFREALTSIPGKVIDGAIDMVKEWITGSGAGGAAGAVSFAQSQAGKPYVWGGVGPAGYDCSGFMAAIANVLRGQSPYRRLGTTETMPWPGFKAGSSPIFTIGNTHAGVGHMSGTLLGGLKVESRGSAGVVVGSGARGANDSLFPERWGFAADDGGYLPPGWSSVFNGTGSAERILTDPQWRVLAAAAKGSDGPEEFHLTSGLLEIADDGLVRIVDGRLERRIGTAITNGRRA